MKFDSYIRDGLHDVAAPVTPDPALRTRVLAEARAQSRPRLSRRARVAAVTAVVLCVALTTAIASGPAAYLVSDWMPNATIQSVDDKATLEDKLGYAVRVPETLLEGYTLKEASVEPFSARDSANNEVLRFLTLGAYYTNGSDTANLSAERVGDYEYSETLSDSTRAETREISGVTVTYHVIPTICVPASEGRDAFTEEQLAAEERGEMFLSVGSDAREESNYCVVKWTQDGIMYSIGMHDDRCDWTADDYFAAAQTVIETAV